MPNCISDRFGLSIPHGGLHDFIESADNALRTIRETPFHSVVGKSFLHQSDEAATYFEKFLSGASAAREPFTAIYCELNGFAINPGRWYFETLGYTTPGKVGEVDWVRDERCAAVAEPTFTLTGMEKVQEAFANYYLRETKPLYVEIAAELAEHLVTARFMELVAAAHSKLRDRSADGKLIPFFSTAHDWDDIHCAS